MAFAILRFQKLKSLAVIDQTVAHLKRARETLNADGAKKSNNDWLTGPPAGVTIGEAVAARLPANRRKDAVVAMEAVLSASPEWFRPDDPTTPGVWDKERTRAWVESSHVWLEHEFGDRLIGAVAHLDEATPHIQAVIIPLDVRGRLCAKRMFGPDALRRMQTSYAKAVAPLGIERGIRGSVATHTHVREWYASVEAAHVAPELLAADRFMLGLGKLPKTIVDLQAQAESARFLKKQRDEARANVAMLARERDEAKRQASLVRTLPLDRVMRVLGGEQDAADDRRWNLPSLGVTTIDKDKPHRFFSERANKGGAGAIDLVKAETGWDFDQAVRFLGTEFTATAVAADAAHMAALTVGDDVRQKLTDKEAPLRLEDRAPAAQAERSVVEKSLIAAGIDAAIIQSALAAGDLEATRQGERVFARWTLRDGRGSAVGFSLEDPVGDFRTTRGKPGIFACDAEFQAADLYEDDSPQLWVARTPTEAMAAISASRSLAVPALEPEARARAVATIDDLPAALNAVAAMAKSELATVVICAAATPSGKEMATELAARLAPHKIKPRDLRWALSAVRATNWLELAKKMAGGASAIVTQIQVAYAKLAAAAKSAKPLAPGHDIGEH